MKSDLELKIVPVFVICLLFFVYFSHEQTKLFLCVCVCVYPVHFPNCPFLSKLVNSTVIFPSTLPL